MEIILLLLLIVLLVFLYLYFKIRKSLRSFSEVAFGTSNIIEGFKNQAIKLENEPKSVAGMESLLLPKLNKDFPNLNINEMKKIAENKILFDESLSLGEDTLFVFQYLRYCNQVRFVEYSAYIYNQIGNTSLMTKFRKDGYYNAKKVYGRLADIITQICGSEIPINYQRVYKNVLMVYIRKLIYNKRLVSKQYIKTIIKDYTEDLIVRNTSTGFDNVSCIQKVINILIDKRKNNLLYLLLKIHVMTRGI